MIYGIPAKPGSIMSVLIRSIRIHIIVIVSNMHVTQILPKAERRERERETETERVEYGLAIIRTTTSPRRTHC